MTIVVVPVQRRLALPLWCACARRMIDAHLGGVSRGIAEGKSPFGLRNLRFGRCEHGRWRRMSAEDLQMIRNIRVDIVGGGIGGITLGCALHRFGIDIRIFEQAPAFQVAGYGLTLQRNALQALDTIGLRESILQRASDIRRGSRRRPTGHVLTRMKLNRCAIHRATLLWARMESVPASCLQLARMYDWVMAQGDGARIPNRALQCANG
jgi:FAD binding domain